MAYAILFAGKKLRQSAPFKKGANAPFNIIVNIEQQCYKR
jgi:hypothetical protein